MFNFIIYSALLVFIDLFTKRMAVQQLAFGKQIVLIPHFFQLVYVENTGAAFGLLKNLSWLLVFIALVVGLFILHYINSEKCKSRLEFAGLVFLFAGTAGNLINRLMLGYVVDFFDLPYWPTFNLADIFINVGVFLLILYIIISKRKHIK